MEALELFFFLGEEIVADDRNERKSNVSCVKERGRSTKAASATLPNVDL